MSAAEDPKASEGQKEQSKAEPKTAVEDQQTNESSKNQKRGIFHSIGDYGHDFGGHGHSFGGHGQSFGGHDFGGHDFGASEHHHEHVKTITIEKKVPVPYTVTKHIPYTVEKKVPYEVLLIS